MSSTESVQHLIKALVPTFLFLTLGTESKLELDDRNCLGCLTGVSSECKFAGCLECLIGNCTDLKNKAIS